MDSIVSKIDYSHIFYAYTDTMPRYIVPPEDFQNDVTITNNEKKLLVRISSGRYSAVIGGFATPDVAVLKLR